MNDYWFLCRDTGTIKYFSSFPDFDEADPDFDEADVFFYLEEHGIDPVWIFSGEVVVEPKPVIDYDNRCEEQEGTE